MQNVSVKKDILVGTEDTVINMISYSKETLYHFNCGDCKNWWSYASVENYKPYIMVCPHCGEMQKIEPLIEEEDLVYPA